MEGGGGGEGGRGKVGLLEGLEREGGRKEEEED